MTLSKLIFFGSSLFSTIVLEKLLNVQGLTLYAVVTTPDRPVGRHLKLTPNPVKVLAQKHDIPVYATLEPRTYNLAPNAIGLVAAYGKIIPQEVLDKFNGQIYNIHPSLLPKYRGPSPLQQQILDGVTETGVTIIGLDSQMDHGPIIATARDTIRPDDTTISLGNRLFALGTDLILNSQFSILNQIPIPQNHKKATYTQKITRQDGFLKFEEFRNCLEIENCKLKIERMHRAFAGWPGVWTLTPQNQRMKLVSLSPFLVQLEGHTPIPWTDFPNQR